MMRALIVYLLCMLGVLLFVNVYLPKSIESVESRQQSINRLLQPPSNVIE